MLTEQAKELYKFVPGKNIDHELKMLDCKFSHLLEEIQRLEAENKKLKDEHYKDETLAAAQERIDELEHYCPIVLNEQEHEIVKKFFKNHCHCCDAYRRSGQVRYIYTSTSIVDVIEIECSCGATEFIKDF